MPAKQFKARHHSAVLHLDLRAPRAVPAHSPAANRGIEKRESGRFDRNARSREDQRRLMAMDCPSRPLGGDDRGRASLLAPHRDLSLHRQRLYRRRCRARGPADQRRREACLCAGRRQGRLGRSPVRPRPDALRCGLAQCARAIRRGCLRRRHCRRCLEGRGRQTRVEARGARRRDRQISRGQGCAEAGRAAVGPTHRGAEGLARRAASFQRRRGRVRQGARRQDHRDHADRAA